MLSKARWCPVSACMTSLLFSISQARHQELTSDLPSMDGIENFSIGMDFVLIIYSKSYLISSTFSENCWHLKKGYMHMNYILWGLSVVTKIYFWVEHEIQQIFDWISRGTGIFISSFSLCSKNNFSLPLPSHTYTTFLTRSTGWLVGEDDKINTIQIFCHVCIY